MTIELTTALRDALPGPDPFTAILRLDGTVYREHKHRRTFRVELGGEAYFVKVHGASGWGEILKHVLRCQGVHLIVQGY